MEFIKLDIMGKFGWTEEEYENTSRDLIDLIIGRAEIDSKK